MTARCERWAVISGGFIRERVAREHQGDLLYEGNRRGAVFTMTLPPFDR